MDDDEEDPPDCFWCEGSGWLDDPDGGTMTCMHCDGSGKEE